MNKEELDDALNMVDSWSAYCSVWMMLIWVLLMVWLLRS